MAVTTQAKYSNQLLQKNSQISIARNENFKQHGWLANKDKE